MATICRHLGFAALCLGAILATPHALQAQANRPLDATVTATSTTDASTDASTDTSAAVAAKHSRESKMSPVSADRRSSSSTALSGTTSGTRSTQSSVASSATGSAASHSTFDDQRAGDALSKFDDDDPMRALTADIAGEGRSLRRDLSSRDAEQDAARDAADRIGGTPAPRLPDYSQVGFSADTDPNLNTRVGAGISIDDIPAPGGPASPGVPMVPGLPASPGLPVNPTNPTDDGVTRSASETLANGSASAKATDDDAATLEPSADDQKSLFAPGASLDDEGEIQDASGPQDNWVLKTLTALGLIVGLIFGLRKVFVRLTGQPLASKATGAVEVLTRVAVAPRNHVLIVRVGGRILVLGDSSNGLSTLASIDDPEEVASLLMTINAGRSDTIAGDFSQMIRSFDDEIDPRDRLAAEGGDHSEGQVDRARNELSGVLSRLRTMGKGWEA